MSFMNDFTLSNIQYVAVKLKRNSVRSQQTAVCSQKRFFVRSVYDLTCVDYEAYTVDNKF